MEYDNINISNIDEIIAQTVKEKIENIMKIEQDQYLEENPGIKNGTYKRNLKTKYGELKLFIYLWLCLTYNAHNQKIL